MMSWLTAPSDGAVRLILLSLLFDIDGYLKRYAGGLVAQATRIVAYRVSRLRPMMRLSASLSCGSRYFGNLAHDDRSDFYYVEADVRRFDVKNPFGGFNLRV